MPIIGLLAGFVGECAGFINGELWRRYVAIMLDGMRSRSDQTRLAVDALEDEQLDMAMRTWRPPGRR